MQRRGPPGAANGAASGLRGHHSDAWGGHGAVPSAAIEPLPSHTTQVPLSGPGGGCGGGDPYHEVAAHRSFSGGAGSRHQAPVHIRLYQDKDERRKRLEEARHRRLLEEEEDIRIAAQRALGRAPSPSRAQSPDSSLLAEHPPPPTHVAQPPRSGATTPKRDRPPMPERPLSASQSTGSLQRRSAGPGGGGGACGGASRGSRGGPSPASTTVGPAVVATNGPVQQGDSPGAAASSVASAPFAPQTSREEAGSPRSIGGGALGAPGQHSVGTGLETPSVASESGALHGLQSVPSVSVLGPEDSADATNALNVSSCEDTNNLRQVVLSQQQRIEFLENMHQQALRQLRRTREELAAAQQQRFQEADKLLGLEQMIGEMQAFRFEGDRQMQMRWEDWLQRSRTILES